MKLDKLFESTKSDEADTVVRASAPGKLGDFVTSAQAAKILGVAMSRIRQLVGEKKLTSHKPEVGRRDHLFKKSQVENLKGKEKDEGGRPKGS